MDCRDEPPCNGQLGQNPEVSKFAISLCSSLWSFPCGAFLKCLWVHHLCFVLVNRLAFVPLEFLCCSTCPLLWLLLKRHSDGIKDLVKRIRVCGTFHFPMSRVGRYSSKVFSREFHLVLTCWRTWIGTGICANRLQHTLSNYRSDVMLWVSAILSWLLQPLIGTLWSTILQILKYASTALKMCNVID